MLRTVIFDLDGVLINSEPLMKFAFQQTYRKVVGNGDPPLDAFFQRMGKSLTVICDEIGLPAEFIPHYREICCKNVDRINVFPGTEKLLCHLRDSDIRMGIVTGKERRRTQQILEYFELAGFFDPVMTCDTLNHPKPHPEGIETILAAHGCPAINAVMIGDAVSDIQCAQRAGVCSIGVTWGIRPEHMIRHSDPSHVAYDLEGLSLLLERMIGRNRVTV